MPILVEVQSEGIRHGGELIGELGEVELQASKSF